ncbi:unnamed protein product [Rangifer tarandus platyrhynchus]|uniref:Uncharacterized protein n=1 Tax=Rangifer tarandus platyrhynchus TaxID=3082113 RepID=A0ABN8ZZP4_RANTA|nr:unnamed protein product [Rangifer tarandus platyrhynchus]
MVRSMGSQRIRHDLATEQQQGCCWWFGCSPNQKSQTLSMGLCDELQHLGILEAFLTSMLTEAASPHDKILHILRDQVYPKLSEGSQNKGMMPHGGEGVLGPKLCLPRSTLELCLSFVLFCFFLSKLWGRQKSGLIHPASQMWKVRPGEMNDSPERAEELEIKSCYSFYFGAAVTK